MSPLLFNSSFQLVLLYRINKLDDTVNCLSELHAYIIDFIINVDRITLERNRTTTSSNSNTLNISTQWSKTICNDHYEMHNMKIIILHVSQKTEWMKTVVIKKTWLYRRIGWLFGKIDSVREWLKMVRWGIAWKLIGMWVISIVKESRELQPKLINCRTWQYLYFGLYNKFSLCVCVFDISHMPTNHNKLKTFFNILHR